MKATRSDGVQLPQLAGSMGEPRKRRVSVDLATYGDQIAIFFSSIEVRRYHAQATKLDPVHLPWKALLEQRELAPFPGVRADLSRKDEAAREANRLIEFLNTTEDVLVFKIALNKLLHLVQGKFFYPGEEYRPELLDEAIKKSEEE